MFDHLKITNYFKGVARGYFAIDVTTKKKLDVRTWWPTLFKDTNDFCKSYDSFYKSS